MAMNKKTWSILFLALIVGLYVIWCTDWLKPVPRFEPASLSLGKLTELTNQARAKEKLPPLAPSALLTNAAQLKAVDILRNQYFRHAGPFGKNLQYWLKKVGYKYSEAGENLSLNFYSEEGVIKNWLESPKHRANILDKDFTEIGLAAIAGRFRGVDTVIVVQMFGRP
ncbi:hypothetical protein HY224_00780 [Candidatus Uhrbacteria bacterium]|nr:hypothetical protein [Candidatus Uhrbacteria bacterium]